MTGPSIPRLPGPLDFLTQGVGAGFQAYDQERQRKYEEAQTGARLILGLIQAGKLDPSLISDPAFQQTLDAAKIPQPPASAVIPSVPAETARRTVGRIQGAAPGSTEESLLLDLPSAGQIREADLLAEAARIKKEVMDKYPAVGRKLAGVFAPEATTGLEQVAGAAFDPGAYLDAAYRFVADAQGDPQAAKIKAQADPQYAELVTSGQLSDEYFAQAARQYATEDEKLRIQRLEAANRRAAIDAEYRNFQAQDRSFDTEVQRLLRIMDQSTLTTGENAMIGMARRKLEKDPNAKLNGLEQSALEKYTRYNSAFQELENLQNQRGQLRGQFIGTKSPPVPTGNVNPAKVQATKLGLQRGDVTPEQVRNSPALTPEEKAEILRGTSGRPSGKAPPTSRDRF